MSGLFQKMLDHPIATAIVLSCIGEAVSEVVRAVKK